MMLIVTQKQDAWITIEPADGLEQSMTLREAFAHGPIRVKLVHIGHRRVRLGIQAPSSLRVLRGKSASADWNNVGATTADPIPFGKGP